jgi:hypothetical protein
LAFNIFFQNLDVAVLYSVTVADNALLPQILFAVMFIIAVAGIVFNLLVGSVLGHGGHGHAGHDHCHSHVPKKECKASGASHDHGDVEHGHAGHDHQADHVHEVHAHGEAGHKDHDHHNHEDGLEEDSHDNHGGDDNINLRR